jgi:hypothetical protein
VAARRRRHAAGQNRRSEPVLEQLFDLGAMPFS